MRETAYANVYFLNRLFSIKTHSGQRIQRQVFRWRVKISFMVSVVEADGTNVGESRGATLWLLQSLARQHWMLNRLGGMGIGEEEMEGTISVVPCKIFWGRHWKGCEKDYVHHFQWQNVAFKLSWPASSCSSNLIPCAYRETYRREEWGIGDTNSLADSVFFFYLNFLFSLAAVFTVGN